MRKLCGENRDFSRKVHKQLDFIIQFDFVTLKQMGRNVNGNIAELANKIGQFFSKLGLLFPEQSMTAMFKPNKLRVPNSLVKS